METYGWWWQWKYISRSKWNKMKKDMKKSFDKADKLAKQRESDNKKQIKEADNYLEQSLENLDS